MKGSRVIFAAAAVGVCFGVGQVVSFAQSKAGSPVTGVWRVVEVTTTGQNARTVTNPQPGLYIFTANHYAIEMVNRDAPRSELPPEGQRTDKQIADAFGPFTANAGSYEVKGNEITFKRMVAKDPGNMKAGNFQIVTFRLEGKSTLFVTGKANDAGPAQNPTTIKLTRIE
jgi:hypothetical protein